MTPKEDPYAKERAIIKRHLEDMHPENGKLVEAFLEDQEIRGRRPSTLSGYATDLARLDHFLNGRNLLDLTATEARTFLKQVGEGKAPTAHPGKQRRARGGVTATIHASIRIKCFLREHRETDLPLDLRRALRANCKGGLQAPRPIERAEFEALLAAAASSLQSLRDQALVATLYDTSWRAGEVACLRMNSIKWLPDGTARLETPDDAHHLKRGKQRAYMTDRQCLKLLRAWWTWMEENHPNGHDGQQALWPSRKTGRDGTKQVRNYAVYQTIQRLKKEAQLEDRITPHSFRHGWVTRMRRKGMDASLVLKQTGWANIKMLKVYEHLDRQDLERERRRLEGLDDSGQPIQEQATTGAINAGTKTCPACAETIKAAASRCKHCHMDLPAKHARP